MKTAQAFHLYVLATADRPGLRKVLADLGLEAEPFTDPTKVVHPALVVASASNPSAAARSDGRSAGPRTSSAGS